MPWIECTLCVFVKIERKWIKWRWQTILPVVTNTMLKIFKHFTWSTLKSFENNSKFRALFRWQKNVTFTLKFNACERFVTFTAKDQLRCLSLCISFTLFLQIFAYEIGPCSQLICINSHLKTATSAFGECVKLCAMH